MTKARFALAGALLALAVPLAAQDTTAQGVHITLQYNVGTRPGVVVLPVAGAGGDSIQTILQRDLDYGDRVNVIAIPDSMAAAVRGGLDSTGKVRTMGYAVFKTLGAAAVIQATNTSRGLHVALHDVARGQVIDVNEFPLPPDSLSRGWRMAVHRVSDEVERWVTGVRGIAATRIAYVRNHAVRIVDSDGADDLTIPMAGAGMSPAWSPDARMIAYSTFGEGSRIVVYTLATGQSRSFGERRNTNVSTPVFSPDGSAIVYTLAGENGSDLFSAPVGGGPAARLTAGGGTDNSTPAFSPDGRRIAFTSGRAGPPEIYIMDADGTNVSMFTDYAFSTRNYRSNPDWSPDGLSLAYQAYQPDSSGVFQIFTMSLRDRTPHQLTSDGENEDPSWAPDARHLVFTSTRSGTKQLWVIDSQSGRLRQLTHGAAMSRLGAWSPRLAP
ncbi:MAG: PD40 domain-containing protein [Gemmatimonadota bacterium]|nr:PD40 domain-containing protein [Gemmatimonadota bacterium]MDE3172640.1 PD40 domain-containing protein [Gemmatimonadota bacterium]MDE3217121.1 PD40 domain-containing protein [Gemmatimonadota bacterium]